jgi:hypothetical protein
MQGEDREDRRGNLVLRLDAVLRSVATFSSHERGDREPATGGFFAGLPYTEHNGIKNI